MLDYIMLWTCVRSWWPVGILICLSWLETFHGAVGLVKGGPLASAMQTLGRSAVYFLTVHTFPQARGESSICACVLCKGFCLLESCLPREAVSLLIPSACAALGTRAGSIWFPILITAWAASETIRYPYYIGAYSSLSVLFARV